jgi:sulfatase maturation enzyme AslB (radical SAM superfamily)
MACSVSTINVVMSKKIAQLTKVIYYLNTKNEDSQMQLNALADNHDEELEEITIKDEQIIQALKLEVIKLFT